MDSRRHVGTSKWHEEPGAVLRQAPASSKQGRRPFKGIVRANEALREPGASQPGRRKRHAEMEKEETLVRTDATLILGESSQQAAMK